MKNLIASLSTILLFPLSGLTAQADPATEHILYNFGATPTDGANPFSRLTFNSDGNLFGTTAGGGTASPAGTVFELTKASGFTQQIILHNFGVTPNDGSSPGASVVFDSVGDLFGTTPEGGAYNAGTVFKLTKSSGYTEETILYSFGATPTDGATPNELTFNSDGDLLGTTQEGGTNNIADGGDGILFKLTKASGYKTEVVLHNFGATSTDGAMPFGNVTFDNDGNLFGVTSSGGSHNKGTVYEFTQASGYTTGAVLYNFGATPTDGNDPLFGVVFDKKGNLFGTTQAGGTNNKGTLFELTKSSGFTEETTLYNFGSTPTDGSRPSGIIFDAKCNLLGTTRDGGANGHGTLFGFSNGTEYKAENILYNFGATSTDGADPNGIILDDAGNAFGTTANGGTHNLSSTRGDGVAFKMTLPAIPGNASEVSVRTKGKHFILTRSCGDLSQELPVSFHINVKVLHGSNLLSRNRHVSFAAGETTKVIHLPRIKELAKATGTSLKVILQLIPSPDLTPSIHSKAKKAYIIDPDAARATLTIVVPPLPIPTTCSPYLF